MNRCTIALFAIACLLATSNSRADRPAPAIERDESRELVKQLGSDEFRTREAADAKLSALGPKAKVALKEGLASTDAEIRYRCARLLEVLKPVERRAEQQAELLRLAIRAGKKLRPGDDAIKSTQNETEAVITFVNKSGGTIKLYWIDFEGDRQLYEMLENDAQLDRQTYLNHVWLVTDAEDRALSLYFADNKSRKEVIVAPKK